MVLLFLIIASSSFKKLFFLAGAKKSNHAGKGKMSFLKNNFSARK
jgi:hypothetical protein